MGHGESEEELPAAPASCACPHAAMRCLSDSRCRRATTDSTVDGWTRAMMPRGLPPLPACSPPLGFRVLGFGFGI